MTDEYGEPVGWHSVQDTLRNKLLQPGQKVNIGPIAYPGWLILTALLCNSPFADVSHSIWGKPVTFSAYNLFVTGAWTPVSGVAVLQVYDPLNSWYVMGYSSNPPQWFKKGADIWVTAPTRNPLTGAAITTPVLVTGLTYYYIELRNVSLFVDKMKQVTTELPLELKALKRMT